VRQRPSTAGCVAAEAVLEIALESAPPLDEGLASIHATTDRIVESPAIRGALVTVGSMLHHATW
jgi:hypothetical protein